MGDLHDPAQDMPIQRQRRLLGWQVDEVERDAGYRPTERTIKEELARAVSLGRLRYVNGKSHRIAGYYPADATSGQ